MSEHEQRIFNYELVPEGRQVLNIPKGAEILGVIEKYGLPFLLARVDEEQATEHRVFRVVTTGEVFNPEILSYIGTLRLGGETARDAWYTMHVWEVETALTAKHPDPIHPRFQEDLKNLRDEITPERNEGLRRLQNDAALAEELNR